MNTGTQKPRGFRDILFSEAARRERIVGVASSFFADAGYELVETPSVENPETLLLGQDSLSNTFRFVDVDGNLIALRSDVTGSLARVVATRFSLIDPPYRLRYVADVFQEQESLRGSDRQQTQIGLECYGLSSDEGDSEVLGLTLGGLTAIGLQGVKLHMSDVNVVASLLPACGDVAAAHSDLESWREEFWSAWATGDFIRLKELTLPLSAGGILEDDASEALRKLLALRGGPEVLDQALELAGHDEVARQAIENLRRSFTAISDYDVVIDFSLASTHSYYSGLIFEVNAPQFDGRYCCVGRGGRYDTLLEQFGRKMPAVGFMYDLASLEAVVASFEQAECGGEANGAYLAGSALDSAGNGLVGSSTEGRPPLRIAVPKGRLYGECIELLARAGVSLPGLDDPGRTLRISDERFDVIIAKPTDVAIYVSRGAADIGISGRDTLVEADFPLLQLIDLQFGGCEFVVAAPEGLDCSLDELSLRLGTIRVATKHPRLTQQFFDGRGIQVEIVKLNGNIELAPLIGISDLIVDLTQTGTTLRENKLHVVEAVLPSTGRFVAQYSAARTDPRVLELAEKLEALLESGETQC